MNEGDERAWRHGIATMEDFVSDEEIEKLILSFAAGRGEKSVTVEELEELVEWARGTRLASAILTSILMGDSDVVAVRNGEAIVRLNAEGKKAAERVARRMGLPVDD